MSTQPALVDILGIGFGPANIALAVALEEMGAKWSAVFLESKPTAQWQPGMLFGGSDIQNHPLRDLVTPRNPRSRYTFTNFLFEHDRLFEHLNLGLPYPMRLEYAQYIAWVASHFEHQVRYGCNVQRLSVVHDPCHGLVYEAHDANGIIYRARTLVVAPGRTPYVPPPLDALRSPCVTHLTDYLPALARLQTSCSPGQTLRIAVVGGSQSAVEILLHLSETLPQAEIIGLGRRFGYRLKDTSPFTGEVYFPEFVDLFFSSSAAQKNSLRQDLHATNYASADADVLDRLYQRLYMNRLQGRDHLQVWRCTQIQSARCNAHQVVLDVQRSDMGPDVSSMAFDWVIAATGFRDIGSAAHQERWPPLLEGLVPHLSLDTAGCLQVGLDYSVAMRDVHPQGRLMLNGLCESSHGMGDAGSFSLLALRSQTIAQSLHATLSENKPVDTEDAPLLAIT